MANNLCSFVYPNTHVTNGVIKSSFWPHYGIDIVAKDGDPIMSAASGVVLDSAAKKEFNENHIKAKSLLELYK